MTIRCQLNPKINIKNLEQERGVPASTLGSCGGKTGELSKLELILKLKNDK